MSARVPLSPRHANWPRNHQHVLGGNKPSPVSILLNEAAISCKKRKHVADPLPAFEDEVQCPVNAKNIEDLYAPAGSEVVAIPPPKKQKANNKAAVPAQVCPRRPVPKKIKEEARESNAEWRRKYAKIMKSHIFYFDLADGTKCTELMDGVVTAGASIENFFSKKVTVVITTRSLPSDASAAPSKENHAAARTTTHRKAPKSPRGNDLHRGLRGSPTEKNPFLDSQNILLKAQEWGIKVWSLDKAYTVVRGLFGADSPAKPSAAKARSLPHLLRSEALSGITHERDPEVLRPDHQYFPARSFYLLVEDSTGEHRPIVAKEYDRPKRGDSPEWPILHGGIEGRTNAFCPKGCIGPAPTREINFAFPKAPAVARLTAPGATNLGVNSLRKSISLQNLQKKLGSAPTGLQPSLLPAPLHVGKMGENEGFLAASGNSQGITSNIASMTSGAPVANGKATGGTMLDQRLALLGKRQFMSHSASLGGAGLGNKDMSNLLAKASMPVMKRSLSLDAGLNKKNPARPQMPCKPGYCENCRQKYEDFADHVETKRHRKFALNADNWLELDDMLEEVVRPIHPDYLDKRSNRGYETVSDGSEAEADEESYDVTDEDMDD